MPEKPTPLEALAAELVTPERQFPPRTPHTYAHVGAEALQVAEVLHIATAYPDLPEHARVYEFPGK